MKFNDTAVMRKAFNLYKVPLVAPLAHSFPKKLDAGYEPAWHEFLRTKIVKTLQQNKDTSEARYNIVMAFLSFIGSIDSAQLNSKKLCAVSAELLDLKSCYQSLSHCLTVKRLTHNMLLRDHKFKVSFEFTDFIRCVSNVCVSGYLIYAPRKGQSLDALLSSLVPSTFPVMPSNLSGTVGKKKQTFPSISTLLSQDTWHYIDSSTAFSLRAGRAKLGTLVLKYDLFPNAFLFVGDQSPEFASNLIHRIQKTSILIPH